MTMSGLKERLRADRVAAMRAHDETAKNALGMALTAIQRAEKQPTGSELDITGELNDEQVLAILKKEVSSRKDSAEAYRAGNRQDLVDKELAEVEVLQRYLPAALTDAELDALVAAEITAAARSLGEAPTMRQMGLIIKAVNAAAQGRAEGAVVAAKVKAALQQ